MKLIGMIAMMVFAGSVYGADRIGNGGGSWACVEADGAVRSAMLVDLFEAEQEFQLFVPGGGMAVTPQEIYFARKEWMRANLPAAFSQLQPFFTRVETNLVMTNAALAVVDDSLFRVTPLAKDCAGGRWEYTQLANFTSYGKVLVRSDLWQNPALPALHKAALMVHEAVYLRMREELKDADSVRARQITGLLFSNLPSAEINRRIGEIMQVKPGQKPAPKPVPEQWVCSIRNSSSSKTFIGTGGLEVEAETVAQQACGDQGYASYCTQSPACEPIVNTSDSVACSAKNSSSSRVFLGKGRNSVEARARALMACEKEGYSSYCAVVRCS